jgi:pyruvate kinase
MSEASRRAKIVCTLGPASNTPEILTKMIEAGMDVARLNFSHGDHSDHRATYELVRDLSARMGKPIAILQDLQGPKIRVGRFLDGKVALERGQRFTITTESVMGDAKRVSTTYADLTEDTKAGDRLLLDDGNIDLVVVEVDGPNVITEVVIGGALSNNKGINLPDAAVSAPSMTEKDKADLAFGLELGVDIVALSFVRTSLDLHMLRHLMAGCKSPPSIVSKIEKPQAIDELDAIIGVSDGIMIARGDLGVELPPERVPMLQKLAIRKALSQATFTITATQMLDSMTQNPRPTRAEASDVANAVMDGTDAVMLSGETAAGKYPVRSVSMMDRIIREVEGSHSYRAQPDPKFMIGMNRFPNAVAKSATVAADELGVRAIVVFTGSGRTAELLTAYRPSVEIVAVTPNLEVVPRMAAFWGVTPRFVRELDNTDEMVASVEALLRTEGLAVPGDEIIILMGTPVGSGAETNMIKFHRLAPDATGVVPQSQW